MFKDLKINFGTLELDEMDPGKYFFCLLLISRKEGGSISAYALKSYTSEHHTYGILVMELMENRLSEHWLNDSRYLGMSRAKNLMKFYA